MLLSWSVGRLVSSVQYICVYTAAPNTAPEEAPWPVTPKNNKLEMVHETDLKICQPKLSLPKNIAA